jgi:hypothetical protein
LKRFFSLYVSKMEHYIIVYCTIYPHLWMNIYYVVNDKVILKK